MKFNERNEYIRPFIDPRKEYFKKDSERVEKNFDTETYFDDNGVIRWKSNNSVPPKDILEFWAYREKPFNYKLAEQTRKKEDDEFLEEYRKQMANHQPSEEELFEMRAAFGEGTTVVNVFTGKKTKL